MKACLRDLGISGQIKKNAENSVRSYKIRQFKGRGKKYKTDHTAYNKEIQTHSLRNGQHICFEFSGRKIFIQLCTDNTCSYSF